MLQFISQAFKDATRTKAPCADRYYVDFRIRDFLPTQDCAPTFTPITAAENRPGSHDFTGGYLRHVLPMASRFTAELYFYPQFSWNDANYHTLFEWGFAAANYCRLRWYPPLHCYRFEWNDSGPSSDMTSRLFSSDAEFKVWTKIVVAIDLSTAGATTGSALYWQGNLERDFWSSPISQKVTSYPILHLRCDRTITAGAYKINHVRLFPDYVATASDVANDFRNVKAEEVFWPFNGTAIGRTRCAVTSRVRSVSHQRRSEDEDTGALVANTLTLTLNNKSGWFSDDQYAAFDPQNEVYNGLSTEKFMGSRCRVEAETWANGLYETYLRGRVNSALFARNTEVGSTPTVTIECEDDAVVLAESPQDKTSVWENKKLASGTEDDSLVHLITRLGSKRKVTNYLGNTRFLYAPVAQEWPVVASSNATWLRSYPSPYFITSTSGQVTMQAGGSLSFHQFAKFSPWRTLNVGDQFVFGIWIKPGVALAGACAISIYECTNQARNATGGTMSFSAFCPGCWTLAWVTITITNPLSNGIECYVSCASPNLAGVDFTSGLLTDGLRIPDWDPMNLQRNTNGEQLWPYRQETSYDTIAFDVDPVTSETHPWAVVAEGDDPWSHITDLAKATCAYYAGMNTVGNFKYRTPFKDGYVDPVPLEVVQAPRSVVSDMELAKANRVITRGVSIVKEEAESLVWSAEAAGLFPSSIGGPLKYLMNPGDTWPDPNTYGDLWAMYDDVKLPVKTTSAPATSVPRQPIASVHLADPNVSKELIGVKNPRVVYNAADAFNVIQVDLTTTFDAATRPDGAQLSIRNATAAVRYLLGAGIIGKKVWRFSNKRGYVFDSLIDYNDVARNGQRVVELGNNYMVGQSIVRKTADWLTKFCRGKKHRYQWTVPGEVLWYEPGEWYSLIIGEPGDAEYYVTTARCIGVSYERNVGSLGTTVLVFAEVQQNWTFNASALARYIMSGQLEGSIFKTEVTVATNGYLGPADYYLDGTDDYVQLQAAMDRVSGLGSGRVVLTRGDIYLGSSYLFPRDNVALVGVGMDLTIIHGNAGWLHGGVYGARTAVSPLTNAQFRDFTLDVGFYGMELDYVKDCLVVNVKTKHITLYDFYIKHADGLIMTGCVVDGDPTWPLLTWGKYGIWIEALAGKAVRFQGNIVRNLTASYASGNATVGVYLVVSGPFVCQDNAIYNISGIPTGAGVVYGMMIAGGSFAIINANSITNVKNGTVGGDVEGLQVIGTLNAVVTGNTVANCGLDLALANTNGDLFLDVGTATKVLSNSWQ